MNGPVQHAAASARYRTLATRAGYVIGILLVLAALLAIWQKRDDVAEALQALRDPDPAMLAVLSVSIIINILLTGVFFALLLSRYGKAPVREMIAVLAAATLLNYLPLRPGLFARLAYHKAYNNITLRDSVKAQVQAVVISSATAAVILLLVLLCRAVDIGIIWACAGLFFVLVGLSFMKPLRLWMLACITRLLELGTWSARYYAAFALLDHDIDISGAIAMACISMAVTLVPFFSNGLGIREWAIGITSPYITASHITLGLTAELINRAAEIIIVTVCGLIALAWLAHRHRRLRANQM